MLWVLLLGLFVAFVLAWALGANDVANAFGTSVGAKVLTMRQAIIVASIVEFLGAFLLSSQVTDTFRKGLYDPEIYADNPQELMVAMLSALVGCTLWLIIATFVNMPVSSTHSAVGAVLGVTLVAKGPSSIDLGTLLFVFSSWLLSPVLAGFVSMLFYVTLRNLILRHHSALRRGLTFLPFFYGPTVTFLTAFIVYEGSPGLQLHNLPTWLVVTLSGSLGGAAGIIAVCLRPILLVYIENKFQQKKKAEQTKLLVRTNAEPLPLPPSPLKPILKAPTQSSDENATLQTVGKRVSFYGSMELPSIPAVKTKQEYLESDEYLNAEDDLTHERTLPKTPTVDDAIYDDHFQNQIRQWIKKINKEYASEDRKNRKIYSKSEAFEPRVEELFSFLQIMTAMAGGLAHGANDVSNAIAPLSVIYSIWITGGDVLQNQYVPLWILFLGAIGMVLGLCMWGYRVMKTIGEDLTKVTPSRGFNIELGSALTVLLANWIGMPISTTHCKVGSVVGIGLVDSKKAVNWRLFFSVGLAWVITFPVSGVISSLTFLFFDFAQAF